MAEAGSPVDADRLVPVGAGQGTGIQQGTAQVGLAQIGPIE